jgi:hypothetical protein
MHTLPRLFHRDVCYPVFLAALLTFFEVVPVWVFDGAMRS